MMMGGGSSLRVLLAFCKTPKFGDFLNLTGLYFLISTTGAWARLQVPIFEGFLPASVLHRCSSVSELGEGIEVLWEYVC